MVPQRAHALAAAVLLALTTACGGTDSSADTAGTTTASGCRAVESPDPREPETREAPTVELDPDLTHQAVVKTNCGEFTITLDPERSPHAAASFAALADAGYFDATTFHRIVPGFVIQGGDPTASGMGGPGYTTVDKPAADTTYTKGTVAMAKTQAEPSGAAGSQFFVVTGDEVMLPPDYAVIGKVTAGLDVVERIGELGDSASEQPTEPVVVDSIQIRSS